MNIFELHTVATATSELTLGAAQFFAKGGVLMWPLLACSLAAVTVVIERAIFFLRERKLTRSGRSRIEAVLVAAAAGRFDEATERASATRCAAGRVLQAGMQQRAFGLHDALEAAADIEVDRLRHGLSVLDTIITLAPMLGILGTVTGIIRSFHLLGISGVENPTAVTGGIAEALITTAAGLVVAMSALVPFNIFVSQIKRRARALEQVIHRFEVACEKGGQPHGS
jgi:biopolymer transport protein ExbB